MYGEDSSGRKISLLNGSSNGTGPVRPRNAPINTTLTSTTQNQQQPLRRLTFPSTSNIVLPPLAFRTDPAHYHHSRPSLSPKSPSRTPPLVRHDSNSSQSESTTSPMTPGYSQDPMDQHNKQGPYYSFPTRPNPQLYPMMGSLQNLQNPTSLNYPIPQRETINPELTNGSGAFNQQALLNLPPALSYPNPEPSMTAPHRADLQPSTIPQLSPSTATSTSTSLSDKPTSHSAATQTSNATSPASPTPTPVKKKFPCPHASRFNCSDTFTTSGHAARHGKKHTGEKSVVCPTCNKAFTRKDNMKQHERTHKPRSGGMVSTTTTNGRQRDGRSRSPSATPPESMPSAGTEADGFDFGGNNKQRMVSSNGATYAFSNTGARKPHINGRISNAGARSEEDGEGESPGLDALAAAAFMG